MPCQVGVVAHFIYTSIVGIFHQWLATSDADRMMQTIDDLILAARGMARVVGGRPLACNSWTKSRLLISCGGAIIVQLIALSVSFGNEKGIRSGLGQKTELPPQL